MKVNRIKELSSFTTIELMKWFNKVSVEKLSNLIVKEKEYKKYRTLKWNTIVYTKLKTNKEGLLDIITQYVELGKEVKQTKISDKILRKEFNKGYDLAESTANDWIEEHIPPEDDWKTLYKKLSMKCHPDKGGSEELMAMINNIIKPFIGLNRDITEI